MILHHDNVTKLSDTSHKAVLIKGKHDSETVGRGLLPNFPETNRL